MHGYESFAAYATADTMAKTTDAVMELLLKVISFKG
jgi:Zn-dependent oligopeptidase